MHLDLGASYIIQKDRNMVNQGDVYKRQVLVSPVGNEWVGIEWNNLICRTNTGQGNEKTKKTAHFSAFSMNNFGGRSRVNDGTEGNGEGRDEIGG